MLQKWEACLRPEASDSAMMIGNDGTSLMSPEEKLRLTHIAEAAALIAHYLEGISKREFLQDALRQDAVIRRIQNRRSRAAFIKRAFVQDA